MDSIKISLVVLTALAFICSVAAMTMAIVNAARKPKPAFRRFAKAGSDTRG